MVTSHLISLIGFMLRQFLITISPCSFRTQSMVMYYTIASAVRQIPQLSISSFTRTVLNTTQNAARFTWRTIATQTTEQDSLPSQTEDEVKLSQGFVKQFHRIDEGNSYIRILVEGGGCSGFQYKFELDNKVNEDDKVIEREGARLVVDIDSLEFLRGSTIDYHEELIRAAFRVEKNPQAEQGCSCGASFSLKL